MLAQFSIFPVGSKESLSKEVAKILDIIDKSGLTYKFTSMSTIVVMLSHAFSVILRLTISIIAVWLKRLLHHFSPKSGKTSHSATIHCVHVR